MRLIIIILIPTFLISGCQVLQSWEVSEPINSVETHDDNVIWVFHASYEQCGEIYFPSISTAISFLNNHYIEVLDEKEINRATCFACGCSSSLHFAAKINIYDLEQAKALGWGFIKKKKKIKV